MIMMIIVRGSTGTRVIPRPHKGAMGKEVDDNDDDMVMMIALLVLMVLLVLIVMLMITDRFQNGFAGLTNC